MGVRDLVDGVWVFGFGLRFQVVGLGSGVLDSGSGG